MTILTKRRRSRRGSALLAVAYLGVVLAGVVGMYFYRSSLTASTESLVRENISGAQTAANYAAELVISNLTDMDYVVNSEGKKVSVAADWVGINPYGPDNDTKVERRISGRLGDFDYRVRVRAVRETKENHVMPDAWLSSVDLPYYNYGVDELRTFTGAYEVTASARYRHSGKVGDRATLAYDSSIRTVVGLSYNSLANFQDELAVYHTNQPSGFNEDMTQTTVTVPGILDSGSGGGTDPSAPQPVAVPVFNVGGEDHYAVKASYNLDASKEEIIEGLASMKATPSELYSVTNNYWNQGKMTLHYQNNDEINPMIPWTTGFDDTSSGTKQKNQTMVIYDPSRPIDQYVFGGKVARSDFTLYDPNTGSSLMYVRGRSVTLDEANNINEKYESESHPGQMTTSTLVVGKTENILRLYLNFVQPLGIPSHPKADATESEVRQWVSQRWTQQSLGYHSRNRTRIRITSVGRAQRPLDNNSSPARRRWATLIWIKNSDGQFLVRDYHKQATSMSSYGYDEATSPHSAPPNLWNGTYRWAWYGGYLTNEKYHYGSWINPKTIAIDNPRNFRKYLNTRFLTLEELLGVKVTKGPDGIPAKINGSIVVDGVPDFELDNTSSRIPYDPDGTGTVFNEVAQRDNSRNDNWGITGASLASMPPTDGIYVRIEDASTPADFTFNGKRYKRYQTLEDFAFERDISDVGEEEDIRRMTSFHMVLEITPENDSPTNEGMYFDMGLTVTLVFPKKVQMVNRKDDLEALFKQWWQSDRIESLTGKESHVSLSTIPDPVPPGLSDEDKLKEYFKQLGFTNGDEAAKLPGVDTMIDDAGAKTIFGRAKFIDGVLQPDPKAVDNIYYYGRYDLHELYSMNKDHFSRDNFEQAMKNDGIWEDIEDDPDIEIYLANWREKEALKMWKILSSLVPNPDLRPLAHRFDPAYRNQIFFELDTMKELFKSPGDHITARYFTAQAMGFKNQRIPMAYAVRDTDGSLRHARTYADLNPGHSVSTAETPVSDRVVPFIPGEAVPDESQEGFVRLTTNGMPGGIPMYVPMQFHSDLGIKQYNGRDLEGTFIWDAATEADDIAMDRIHDWPDWFTDPSKGIVPRNLRDVLVNDLEYDYEHRGYIGWHREGPKPPLPESDAPEYTIDEYKLMFGDNYEYVLLTEKGYFPYETVEVAGKTYMAAVRPDTPDEVDLEDCVPLLKTPDKMPTFVIEGDELDGAGMLYVNGNLHLKTTLAFHGTLVVLGDLIVSPEQYQVLNANGRPVDKDDHEITWDGSHWYYMDEEGAKQITYPVYEWRGKLVAQGKVMVGGKAMISPEATINGEVRPAGIIDVRGSKQAVDETTNPWLDVAPNEGFAPERLGWNDNAGTSVGTDLWKED